MVVDPELAKANALLKQFQVDGLNNVYQLGCTSTPQNVFAQQQRAFNLIWALNKIRPILNGQGCYCGRWHSRTHSHSGLPFARCWCASFRKDARHSASSTGESHTFLASEHRPMECDALKAPIELVELCRMNDWPLYFMRLENENRAATTLVGADSVQIVVNTKYSDSEGGFSSDSSLRRRQRFSLGHEIGHACLNSHKDYGLQKLLSGDNPHAARYHLMREWQANDFASELLLPQPLMQERMKTFSWDDVIEESATLADEFDVSLTVALRRVTGMATFPALMFYFRTDGVAPQGAIPSRYFSDTELPKPSGTSMPSGSLVARLAADPTSRVSTIRNLSGTIWFPQNKKAQQYKIQESSRRIGDKGYLTFLAITEDEDWSGSRNSRGYDDDDEEWGSDSANKWRRNR